MCFPMGYDIEFRAEDDLYQTFTIPQIDEDHPAMIAAAVGPAHENHLPSHLVHGQ